MISGCDISSEMSSRGGQNPYPGMKPVNLLDIWEDLLSGIRHVYARQSMSKKRYMGLYTYPPVHCYYSDEGLGWLVLDPCSLAMCTTTVPASSSPTRPPALILGGRAIATPTQLEGHSLWALSFTLILAGS